MRNLRIQKGFFHKTRYDFADGLLKRTEHIFWGLFHQKKKDYTLNLSEIKYIENVALITKFIFIKKYAVELISSDDSTYIYDLSKDEAERIVSTAIEMGAVQGEHMIKYVPTLKSMKSIYKGSVILCDLFDKIVLKVYKAKECVEDSLNMHSVLYFDEVKNKGVTGIAFGSIAGGGNANTIEVFGLTKEANQKIYNMILECNPRLEDSDVRIFKSSMPLNPFKWFKEREKIILTDWGFIHKQHKVVIDGKKFLSRTSVIPFESIKTYIHEGRFNKRIEILGNTTLSTQESFSRSAQKEIWRKLKEKGVSNEQGIVIRPTLFNRCKQGNIVLTSSAAIWRYKKETKLLHYENIYSHDFVKKHWYSFSGDVIIRGRRIDARAGEGGDVIMELKQVGRRKGKLLVKTIEQAKLSAGRIGKDK